MGFQTGTQIRPELGNADFSGFARAAEINAQALANLGRDIGGAIVDYGIKKEKKKQEDIRYKTILPYIASTLGEEEAPGMAKLFSKDPQQFSKVMEFVNLQNEQNALQNAIAVNTDTEGKVDYDNVLSSYIELGGSNPAGLAQLVERFEEPGEIKVQTKGGIEVLTQDGKYLSSRSADSGVDPVAAEKAQAETAKTKAETARLEAQTAEIGKPKEMTPAEKMRLIETKVGDVTFGQYLQELKQTKKIKGGKLHQKGLLNFDEDQISAFDYIMRTYPEFLNGMPQAVKDYYSTKNNEPMSMKLGDGTTITLAPQ